MNLIKRKARAKARAKTARLSKQFPKLPFLRSRWTYGRGWRPADGLQPGDVLGARRMAVRSYTAKERVERLATVPVKQRRGWQRREE